MATNKQRLDAVARVIYMGVPGVGGAAFGTILLTAAERLSRVAAQSRDDLAGDGRAANDLRELYDLLRAWRDKLIAAICDGPPIECQCCKRPIPNCARCHEAM